MVTLGRRSTFWRPENVTPTLTGKVKRNHGRADGIPNIQQDMVVCIHDHLIEKTNAYIPIELAFLEEHQQWRETHALSLKTPSEPAGPHYPEPVPGAPGPDPQAARTAVTNRFQGDRLLRRKGNSAQELRWSQERIMPPRDQAETHKRIENSFKYVEEKARRASVTQEAPSP
ncbi:hypothetical protein PG984_013308 [Apiospora sp. TS-2023a]